jgi:hypothetical protein
MTRAPSQPSRGPPGPAKGRPEDRLCAFGAPDPTRALFGDRAPARPRDETPVTLPLERLDETDKAWLLRAGLKGSQARWAPKALVSRGAGVEAHLFSMPRWVAAERGWL